MISPRMDMRRMKNMQYAAGITLFHPYMFGISIVFERFMNYSLSIQRNYTAYAGHAIWWITLKNARIRSPKSG